MFLACFCSSQRQQRLKTELALAVTDSPVASPLYRTGPNLTHYADSSGNRHRLKKLTSRAPRGICRVFGGHTYTNVGKMPNSWTDRDHIWYTYAYSSGNKKNNNPLIPDGHGGLWGHQFINLGKLPNHWTDRDKICIKIHQSIPHPVPRPDKRGGLASGASGLSKLLVNQMT